MTVGIRSWCRLRKRRENKDLSSLLDHQLQHRPIHRHEVIKRMSEFAKDSLTLEETKWVHQNRTTVHALYSNLWLIHPLLSLSLSHPHPIFNSQLRAKLGLKPLVDDGPSKKDKDEEKPSSALDGQEERANENYDKRKQKEKAEREEREARERIAKWVSDSEMVDSALSSLYW